jgi:lipopolysaccharide export system permease protein
MARILFITSNRIGDAVLSTSVLEHALALYPGAALTIVCGPLPAPLFRAEPGLKKLLLIEKRSGRWTNLWSQLRRQRFDLAIDLRGSLVTLALKAEKRFIHRKTREVRHKLLEMAAMMRVERLPLPKIRPDDRAQEDALAALGDPSPILALGPGANFIGKRWPPARFAELVLRLRAGGGPVSGLRTVLFGAPDEAGITGEIREALQAAGAPVLDLAGKLDLLASAAALERAALFVGNDSGLMHIAAAIGAPTLGLFGPSPEKVYGPVGPRARALRGPRSFEEVISVGYMPHIDYSLMEDLAVDKVEAAARELLATGGLA